MAKAEIDKEIILLDGIHLIQKTARRVEIGLSNFHLNFETLPAFEQSIITKNGTLFYSGCAVTKNRSDEVGNPRNILDILLSIINLSVQTVEIIKGLPNIQINNKRINHISIEIGLLFLMRKNNCEHCGNVISHDRLIEIRAHC
jgi:hypothetical protein